MRLAVALAFLFAVAAGRATAEPQPGPGDRDVAIVNHSGHAINEIYASPTSVGQWGEDRLGDQTVPPGRTAHVRLGRTRDCDFDVQVIYENAGREEAHGVNLCRNHQITFDGTGATAPPSAPAHDVTIANRTGRPIQQVLISAADAGEWGDDRLGNASISVGDSTTIHYSGDCNADIRVVFDNRSAEERRGVDLCARPHLAVEPGWTTADVRPDPRAGASETLLLTVTNHAGNPAAALFLTPEGGTERGPDLLGSAGLANGAAVSIAFQRPADTCRFTPHVVFGGKRGEQDLAQLDLCHSTDVELAGRG